jgi:zinc/manganese transport system permease protein
MGSAEWAIVAPALAAGLVVAASHVPLGREVIARGILFLDLALAQVAATGMVAVQARWHEAPPLAGQAAAVGAALAAAGALAWTERHWPAAQEALIGALFVGAASLAVLLLAGDPHGGEHLTDLLAGQILWVTPAQLGVLAVVSTVVLALWRGRRAWFYPAFALAVTASVQLVGVYLVFATLILPALATRTRQGRAGLAVAYAHAGAAYLAGLAMALAWDLPPGPAVVLALAGLAPAVAWGTWRAVPP